MDEFFTDIHQTKVYSSDDPGMDVEILQTVGRTISYPADYAPDLHEEDYKTLAYRSETLPAKKTSSHQLVPGDQVELNSICYSVLDVIAEAGTTAEAANYKVENPKHGVFVLKI